MDVKAPSGTDKAQETQSLHVQGLPERKNKFQNKVHARFEGVGQHLPSLHMHFIKSAHGGIDHITKGFCDWST